LNERQQKAVHHVKTTGKITNQELCELTEVVIRTASRDLEDLVLKGVLVKMGKTERSTHYVLACKLDTNRTNRTCEGKTRHEPAKPATNWDGVRHKGPKIASRSLCARKVPETDRTVAIG
jgi:hypothetical protein